MSKTMAVHVRYKSLYMFISWPSSVKQHCELTMFCTTSEMQTTTANFLYFHLEMNTLFA